MDEDLRSLSFFELARRIERLGADVRNRDFTIGEQARKVEALKAELKAAQDSLAKIESPVFEVGKCYRNKRGEIRGPLVAWNDEPFIYRDVATKQTFDANGMRFHNDPSSFDLTPGPVEPPPTWMPHAFLPNGEYKIDASHIMGVVHMSHSYAELLNGHTTKPTPGRWKVANGTATYLGES